MKTKLLLLFICCHLHLPAQNEALTQAVSNFFARYTTENYKPYNAMAADSLRADSRLHEVRIYANEAFCSQPFTPQCVQAVYQNLQRCLPAPYNSYRITVLNKKGLPIEDLVPNLLRQGAEDPSRLWGKTDYTGNPWVKNTSLPYRIANGLQNRHLFIWASHGRYFKEGQWQWQRPYLFCTTEDLFTQSFVYPFLFPMLEKAGAVVGTPRERDYQTQAAVVDNDRPQQQGTYSEAGQPGCEWGTSADSTGFAAPATLLNDSVFPFKLGTYRTVAATTRRSHLTTATWMPQIPRNGCYAVYVSYASRPNSVPDAHYTVFHKGGRTHLQVNQQMGGGTWVYLGTYEFDKGASPAGRVVLSNHSNHRGVVTADAVRFGGGMGQTERDSAGTSGLPRFLEAARYHAQWAGIPDTLVNTTQGSNDYADDLRVRGNMLNYLGGGSVYLPGTDGQRVPFELSLALHSDAGVRSDRSTYGSLSISTTQDGEGNLFFSSGLSRQASADFASLLLHTLTQDLGQTIGTGWTRRERWDRNYAETRMPGVPSAILEMLSHQNYTDMKYGHDPLFKFTLARSVYKTILRFVNFEHGIKNPTVQPLPVQRFASQLSEDGTEVLLSWEPTPDPLEPTAAPSGYILYTKVGDGGFDNGTPLDNVSRASVRISPDKLYAFRITAVNAGGESFPSETLTAFHASGSRKRVLIVNGFERLSGPAWVDTPDSLGFDLDRDWGVPYLSTTAFSGRQLNFDARAMGLEGPEGLGYSGQELMGKEIAGNTFDYPVCHGDALAACKTYSFCSVSRAAFEQPDFSASRFAAIDYICGLEADRPYNLRKFKTFTPAVRDKLADYLKGGGALLVSGSYIGSDNCKEKEERIFIEDVLKFKYDGSARRDSTDYVNGLNLQFAIHRRPNALHYAAQAPDAILPASRQAFSAFAYGGGQGAGVAYKGHAYRVLSMGFPFECIREEDVRREAMAALMDFLTSED